MYSAGEPTDEVLYAPHLTDEFEQAPRHHGYDDQFAHARNALTHGSKPPVQVVGALCYAYDAAQQDAYGENRHDVHAHDGYDEDGYVRDNLDHVYSRDVGRSLYALTQDGIYDE